MNISHKDLKISRLEQNENRLNRTGNFETISYTFRVLFKENQ